MFAAHARRTDVDAGLGATDHHALPETELEPLAVDHEVGARPDRAPGFELAHERRELRVVGPPSRKRERLATPARGEEIARARADLVAFALAPLALLLGLQHLLEALHCAGQDQRTRFGF